MAFSCLRTDISIVVYKRSNPVTNSVTKKGSLMTEIAIGLLVSVACLISALVLFSGHGVFMVASLNRMDPAEREANYDVKRACRATGVFALTAGVLVLVFIALKYAVLVEGLSAGVLTPYTWFMIIAIIGVLIASNYYISTRCKK